MDEPVKISQLKMSCQAGMVLMAHRRLMATKAVVGNRVIATMIGPFGSVRISTVKK
jgi:hypothetical protein